MQLKKYQHQTLHDLEQYIEVLNHSKSLSAAARIKVAAF